MRGYPGSGGALRGHVLEIWSVKIGQDARPEREGSWIVFSLSKASRSKFGTSNESFAYFSRARFVAQQ